MTKKNLNIFYKSQEILAIPAYSILCADGLYTCFVPSLPEWQISLTLSPYKSWLKNPECYVEVGYIQSKMM